MVHHGTDWPAGTDRPGSMDETSGGPPSEGSAGYHPDSRRLSAALSGNRGAAFGILQNQQWVFIYLLCAVFLIFIIWFYLRLPKQSHYLPLAALGVGIAAGAVGNLIDRIRLNYVVDFFYASCIDFPVFNVADIYVTVSVFLLVFFYFVLL